MEDEGFLYEALALTSGVLF